MSAQTDCEMLFVEIMEAYAGMYNLSGNDVAELFHENQVFEKVLIQHEYLHQISFEEASVLNVKRFDTLNEEWLEFIKSNRSKGGLQHDYDVVIGPVADDNTMETVQLYIANILTATEAVERLRYNNVNNQVSFHTEKALKYLKLIRRFDYAREDI